MKRNRKNAKRLANLILDAKRAANNRDHSFAALLSERAEELAYRMGSPELLKGLSS